MNFSKIFKLIILASITVLIIDIPLKFIVFKVFICENDLAGICPGFAFIFLFIVAVAVITGFLGEKILEKKGKKYEENPLKIILSKVLLYVVIAPLVFLLTFVLSGILQMILYKF